VAVIVVLVLSVLAVGMVRMATSETVGAMAGAKREQVSQCAEAARQLLVSKFHLLGLSPTSIQALNAPLDGANGSTWARGGHIDTAGVTVGQVSVLPPIVTGPQKDVNDETNRIPMSDILKNPLKVTVHCQVGGTAADPTSGRQVEIEFGIRFGI
jgi:type II secretory pathway pseudopilin PulG